MVVALGQKQGVIECVIAATKNGNPHAMNMVADRIVERANDDAGAGLCQRHKFWRGVRAHAGSEHNGLRGPFLQTFWRVQCQGESRICLFNRQQRGGEQRGGVQFGVMRNQSARQFFAAFARRPQKPQVGVEVTALRTTNVVTALDDKRREAEGQAGVGAGHASGACADNGNDHVGDSYDSNKQTLI